MDNDLPTTPYSSGEQMRIMRDLKVHLEEAKEQEDVARVYYTREALEEVKG